MTKTVPAARAEKELQSLASSLYLNVSYEAELVESKDAPPPKPYVRRAVLQDLVVLDGGGRGGGRRGRWARRWRRKPKDCGSANFCVGVVY